MTHTKSAVFRELGLATSHASCESPAAIDSALEHARRAVLALEELRAGMKPYAVPATVLRANRTEHISAPMARVVERLRDGG